MIPIWPSNLPPPNTSFSKAYGQIVRSYAPDRGVHKRILVGQVSSPMNLQFTFSTSELSIFKTFILDTVKVVRRFTFLDPTENVSKEVRCVSQSENTVFTVEYIGYDAWRVFIILEIMP